MINLQGSSPTALLNVKGKWSHIDLSQFLIACHLLMGQMEWLIAGKTEIGWMSTVQRI